MSVQDPALAPWDVSADAYPEGGAAEDMLTFLVRYAVLAPSGHNTQPWLFSVDGTTMTLRADRTRALPVVDPDDRELTMSCGAALLNLRLALRRFGWADDRAVVMPDRSDPDLLARVDLVAADPAAPDERLLFDAITSRRTTRERFANRPVPADAWRALEDDARREGAWLHRVDGQARAALVDLVAEGDRVQMSDRRFRRELAGWIRSNHSARRRGLRGYGLGMGEVMSLAGPVVVRTFDVGRGQAARDRELAEHSPVLAVLGTAGDSPADWMAAGQAMERILLRACSLGLRASFLNQPVEVPSLRPRVAALVGCEPDRPQLVMRFGYGPQARPEPREPAERVTARA